MNTEIDTPLRFGSFELDVRSRELRRGAARVRLQEQPFEILCLMLERPGHVVTRDELRQRLWPEGTFVDFEHSLNAAVKRLRAALGDDADNPRYVETLPRRGYRFIGVVGERPVAAAPSPAQPRVRLAVLPFTSMAEEGQEYFTDGLTEEMIAQLGRFCRGRVGIIARQSSMAFKGTSRGAREIGQALRADYLLEGSVRRDGDRVRITARLVETAGETHLWVESYERHLTDCLSVQAEVASRIAGSLAMELLPDQSPAARGAACEAAYQEYLKGRFHWNKLDDEREARAAVSLEEALACFGRALAIDRDYAAAYGIAARVHVARAQQYLAVPRAALEEARTFARRGLELDPGLAEAHLALGDVRRMRDWDWRGAELAYARAIALNPSQENAHRRYSLMLAAQGRRGEATREADRACELDPLSIVARVSAALVNYLTGDYAAAIRRCAQILELAPQYLPARRLLGAARLQTGETTEALRALKAYADAAPGPMSFAWLAYARGVTGDRAAAAGLLTRLERLARQRYVPGSHLALAHLGLGNVDETFAALAAAREDSDPSLGFVAVDPRFAPVRGDARFAQLVKELGL